jgi:molybdopterin/thiamine biosynthesis adenylyltransferase
MVLALNLGKFAQLYDQDTVYNSFLQMFFKFCYDEVAKVSETAATSLVYILEKFNNDPHK